jgi:hypothetical protein
MLAAGALALWSAASDRRFLAIPLSGQGVLKGGDHSPHSKALKGRTQTLGLRS